MSRSAGPARRSGDPRVRAEARARGRAAPRRRLVVAAVAGAAVVGLALVPLLSGDDQPDAEARGHAEASCDLTAKAEEAASVESDARYAAAVLLLDKAIVESTRAAERDAAYVELDGLVQAVHTAGHSGDHERWRSAMGAARAACRATVGGPG